MVNISKLTDSIKKAEQLTENCEDANSFFDFVCDVTSTLQDIKDTFLELEKLKKYAYSVRSDYESGAGLPFAEEAFNVLTRILGE